MVILLVKDLVTIFSTYGVVYDIKKGKVLKITVDKDELKTSSKLVKSKLNNIVKIFRVFVFTSLPGVGFIEQEKLFPLSGDEEDIVNFLAIEGTDTIKESLDTAKFYNLKKFKDIKRFLYSKYDEETEKNKWEFYKNLENIPKVFEKLSPALQGFIVNKGYEDEYDVEMIDKDISFISDPFKGLEEMTKNNIHFTDSHGGNLMKTSSGKLKWIDLGNNSKAPGTIKIEKIKGYYIMKKLIEALNEKSPKLSEKVRKAFTSAGEQNELLIFVKDTKDDLFKHLEDIKEENEDKFNEVYSIIKNSKDQKEALPAVDLLENIKASLDKDLSDLKKSIMGGISRVISNLKR